MMQTKFMSRVSECACVDCAYNADHNCHTIAITIGDGDRPMCDTFFKSSRHGGVRETAGVGACKVAACQHNTDFECFASNIRIGQDGNQVKCLTFAAA